MKRMELYLNRANQGLPVGRKGMQICHITEQEAKAIINGLTYTDKLSLYALLSEAGHNPLPAQYPVQNPADIADE